ncbi:retrovirus-related pol polyprotein from transposon TNT 1-94 [Tanacetum coccineum]
MDYGASFHATYCKEELERFKLCSGKVHLAHDKTLDIARVGDVVLKTSFGTSWTLKDVRYIPGLTRRLISVGQIDEEGYYVNFEEQQWKVTKGSLVVAHGNKRGSLYMVEIHPEGIGIIINGSGSAAVWFGEAEESFFHNVSEDKETVEQELRIMMLKMVPETPLQFGVAERLSRIFREHGDLCKGSEDVMGRFSSGSDEMRYSFRDTKSHQVIRSRDITFMDLIYGARSATNSSSLTKPIQKSQVVLVDIPKNLAENDSIVAEHGLSSEITQSPENGEPESYSEALSSKESVQWKNAIIEEMVSLEKNQTCSLVRLPAGKKASQILWMFKVKEEQNSSEKEPSYVGAMNDTYAQHTSEGFQLAGVLIFFEDSCNEEPCNDVHRMGDEREVEVLCNFNWPLSELIMEDGVLPERGYSQFNDVSSGYLVSKVS